MGGTLPETNGLHLKMDGWNTFSFPFGAFRPTFRGKLAVRFREGRSKFNDSHVQFNDSHVQFNDSHDVMDGELSNEQKSGRLVLC